MLLNKILKVLLLLLGGVFIILQGFGYEVEGAATSTFMLVILTFIYYEWTQNKTKYFFWFLAAFTFGHIISLFSWLMPEIKEHQINVYYYVSNLLFILAYLFLIVRVLVELNFKKIVTELTIPIIILVVLDVFCVVLVTDTAENALTNYEYALEFFYNTVIMVLLSSALINYMYRNDSKSMLLLVGSMCIVFSEIIQLAYYYILDDSNLVFIYSFFLVLAFMFFYLQSQVAFTGPEPDYVDEYLEEV